MKESVESRDIYELAYYLTKTSCKIERIEVSEAPYPGKPCEDKDARMQAEAGCRKPACLVTITGENLKQLQLDYLNAYAPVDAVSYRKSLSYIRTLVYGEMKKQKGGEPGMAKSPEAQDARKGG